MALFRSFLLSLFLSLFLSLVISLLGFGFGLMEWRLPSGLMASLVRVVTKGQHETSRQFRDAQSKSTAK